MSSKSNKKTDKIIKTNNNTSKSKKIIKVENSDNKMNKSNRSSKSIKFNNANRSKISIEIDDNKKYHLDDDSVIEYLENFITKKLHDDLFKELSNEVPWTYGVYNMFGKPIKTPRLLYCMRDADFNVKDVYTITGSMPWTKSMLKLKKLIEEKTGKIYQYAQLNYYRNGDDYIGYHTDSEVQEDDVIASVSLGAARKFSFRDINYKNSKIKKTYEMTLNKRSLIIMDENSAKKHWKHSLPKMKNVNDVRINITFRPK